MAGSPAPALLRQLRAHIPPGGSGCGTDSDTLAELTARLSVLDANLAWHHEALAQARPASTTMVDFPESGLTGRRG